MTKPISSTDEENPRSHSKISDSYSNNHKNDTIERKIGFLLFDIVKALAGEKEDLDIQTYGIEAVRSGWSVGKFYRVNAVYYQGGYSPDKEGKNIGFFIKCFNTLDNENFSSGLPPRDLEYQLYKIMENSSVVPRAFVFEGLENALVLEHAGRISAEDKLSSLRGEAKSILEEKILKRIARFNSFAHQQAASISDNEVIKEWVKIKRPTAEDAVRYFREYLKVKELEEDARKINKFEENYKVFEKMYGENGDQLIHGDLRGQNIVGPEREEWTEDNIKIVDLGSMVRGDPLYSVAQFVTSPGSKASSKRWDDRLMFYKGAEANALCGVSGIKSVRFRTEEIQRAKRRFYVATIHSAIRGLLKMAKLKSKSPEDYNRIMSERNVLETHDEDMFNNIRTALRQIARRHDKFGLSGDDYKQVLCLEKAVDSYNPSTA